MKILRLLPETDLARIAPLPVDEKRRQLRQHKVGRPPFSYEPLRQSIHDVINVAPGLFGPTEPTPWPKVEQLIRRRCSKSEDEAKTNIAVAKSLHAYAIGEKIRAKQHKIDALRLSLDLRVTYWWPFVMLIDGRPLIPFFDPRRSRRLTMIGRRFAFSMMHQATREADPDLAEVRLGIFQFDSEDDGTRVLRLHTDDDVALYEFGDLDEMIRETYAIWNEVLSEREADARRRGSGTRGPLI